MELSLSKLHHLIAVERCGSFSRAAAELNLSQPALSRSIASLEARYGFKLFNRVGHGVLPTAAGVQVLAQARPMLQQLVAFESNLRLLGGGQIGRLAIGMAPLIASELVPRFASGFFHAGFESQLRVMVRPGEELLQALKSDAVELIIFPESHLPPIDEIDIDQLGLVQPACVVRAGHPLLDRDGLHIDDLAPFPWASSLENARGMPKTSRSTMVCDNYHILRESVMSTDLISICSRAFVETELNAGRLAEINVKGLPLRATRIYVARLKGRVDSPLAVRALATMADYLAGNWQAHRGTEGVQ